VVGPVAPGDGGLAPGGVSQHVSGLIRALHSSGWRVVVYADDTPQGSGRPRDMEWGTLFGPVRLRMAPLVAGATRGGLHTIMRAWADRHRSARMGSRTRTVIAHSVGLAHAYSHARPDVVHYQHADLRPYWGMLAGIDAPEVITAHSLSAFRDFEDEVLHATVEAALRRADAVDRSERRRPPGPTPCTDSGSGSSRGHRQRDRCVAVPARTHCRLMT